MAVCHEGAGASAMMGTTTLHQHFAEAETLCREGDLAAATSLIRDKTDGLWVETELALKAYMVQAATRPGRWQSGNRTERIAQG